MQTCRWLPPAHLRRGRARAVPDKVLPSRRLHRPRSTPLWHHLRFASIMPRPEARHYFRSRGARDLQSCRKAKAHLVAARCAVPPSQLSRGRSRARPRAPCPWASGLPPALVALARALRRAYTRASGPPRSAVLRTARSLFSLSHGPGAAPSRAPTGTEGRAAGPPRGPAPQQKKITKAKRGRGLGWWWRRV